MYYLIIIIYSGIEININDFVFSSLKYVNKIYKYVSFHLNNYINLKVI